MRLNSFVESRISRQDKTAIKTKHAQFRNFLSVQFRPPIPTRQNKTVLSCPCRRCEIF